MINVTISLPNGSTKKVPLDNKEQVQEFISVLPSKIEKGTALHVRCDLLSISGIVRGTK